MRRILLGLSAAVACLTLFCLSAVAQDFTKSYPLTAGGTVRIMNVSGDVKITGGDGNTVVVNAFKEGRDRDKIEIEDLSTGNGVELKVRYPRCGSSEENRHGCSYEADVRFEVTVPRSLNLSLERINTASGNIQVTGVDANINVNTASGDVTVADSHGSVRAATASGTMRIRNVTGQVSASSASGDVEVDITRLEGSENMNFATASGDVNVRMPFDLDADVSMSTVSGNIKTDFAIEVKEPRYGPGRNAEGRIGNGTRKVRLASASGDISLMRSGGGAAF
jgi:DUF4097 and DUF4098 domain-containing protein YvlB